LGPFSSSAFWQEKALVPDLHKVKGCPPLRAKKCLQGN
jgi:hypothetical protein